MIKSPCIAVCKIDYESGHCFGCNRTIEEITDWSSLSDSGKKKIFQRIENMNTSKQKVFSSNQND